MFREKPFLQERAMIVENYRYLDHLEGNSTMTNQNADICREYVEAVFQRARHEMEPKNFHPNWDDQPSRYKVYQQVERLPLPFALPTTFPSMATVMEHLRHPKRVPQALTYEELSTILLLAYGAINRRLDVNWNRDVYDRARYIHANFGRGTASGGGMYPTEIFWACGPGGPLQSGIYHYDNAHHALARLYTGDLTRRIQAALGEHPAAMSTNQFLFISLNFWKNSFKYNSFCYHVVTEDLGALLGSLRLLAASFGSDLQFLLWYPDEELNNLLGLETLFESVFAAIPLSLKGSSPDSTPLRDPAHSQIHLEKLHRPLFTRSSFQRSRTIIRFPTVERVHLASLITDEPRPAREEAQRTSCDEFAPSGVPIALPQPATELLHCQVIEVFQKRQSSFGRFSSHTPLTLSQFA